MNSFVLNSKNVRAEILSSTFSLIIEAENSISSYRLTTNNFLILYTFKDPSRSIPSPHPVAIRGTMAPSTKQDSDAAQATVEDTTMVDADIDNEDIPTLDRQMIRVVSYNTALSARACTHSIDVAHKFFYQAYTDM